MVEDGYEFFGGRGLVTVFSAPNYCDEFDNSGGMMVVDEELRCSFKILKPIERIQGKEGQSGEKAEIKKIGEVD